ncbi:MAG: ABC transporter permease [Gemmatimonadaceae bacterium]
MRTVRKILALVRASWLSATSYRMSMLLSVVGLMLTMLPLYYVATALQPTMAGAIRDEGGHYFSFLLIGTIVYTFIIPALSSVPGALGSGIATGTLEAMLSTPTSFPVLLTGLTGYGFLWTALRSGAALVVGVMLGAQVVWGGALPSAGILVLILVAYIAIGMMDAALLLAFRVRTPIANGVLLLSGLLGGVYYPTDVIPSWIQRLSEAIPLTYGLRAVRRLMLEGAPVHEVTADLVALTAITLALLAAGTLMLAAALQHARRAGTLGQY